jgi:hypothetical protein
MLTEDEAPVNEETPAAEEHAAEPTAAEKELAALKEENARLKAQPAATSHTEKKVPTASDLETYSDEQWGTIEARTGKDKATIIREYKDYELTNRQNSIDAKTNTSEMLQDAIEANPKLIKLRASIKEFMEDVPLADKLDPAKLKRQMDKAITYAKGKHMTSAPETPAPKKGNETPSPKGGADDEGSDELVEGEVKNDDYVGENGLHIKLGKVDKATWKKIQHKTKNPNSVCIPSDFDEKPKFK